MELLLCSQKRVGSPRDQEALEFRLNPYKIIGGCFTGSPSNYRSPKIEEGDGSENISDDDSCTSTYY